MDSLNYTYRGVFNKYYLPRQTGDGCKKSNQFQLYTYLYKNKKHRFIIYNKKKVLIIVVIFYAISWYSIQHTDNKINTNDQCFASIM